MLLLPILRPAREQYVVETRGSPRQRLPLSPVERDGYQSGPFVNALVSIDRLSHSFWPRGVYKNLSALRIEFGPEMPFWASILLYLLFLVIAIFPLETQ